MKAFLIDPEQQSIVEINYDDSDYKNICRLINADLFDVVHLPGRANDVMYVDDTGLSADKRFFKMTGIPTPIAGKALVLGTDHKGDSTSPADATIASLEILITFIADAVAIAMAVQADEDAIQNKAKNVIYIPVADIIKSRVYNNSPK